MFLLLSSVAFAKFSAGIGYIDVPEYRKDNAVSPLPFGWNTIPLISYRGESLSIYGPNIKYHLFKGPIAFDLSLKASGDRYQSRDISLRDTSIDAGFSLRLYFLNVDYHRDVARTYKGENASIGLGWRFQISENFLFIPSVKKEFYSKEFINFYYGVKNSESIYYDSYEVYGYGSKEIIHGSLVYLLGKAERLAFNLTQNYLGDSFTDSPTNDKSQFLVWSLFWSREI
ncbi:MAG: MipA/OmpV family protein [Bdellovibrionota bacterium]|nr:MipA/OmpV family protein [Bdellovibrionota bacterium]